MRSAPHVLGQPFQKNLPCFGCKPNVAGNLPDCLALFSLISFSLHQKKFFLELLTGILGGQEEFLPPYKTRSPSPVAKVPEKLFLEQKKVFPLFFI